MTAQEFAAAIQRGGWKVRQKAGEYRAQCPAHNGEDFNLSFKDGDKALVVSCKSHGCEFHQIMEAVERATGEKRQRQQTNGAYSPGQNVTDRYRYTDEQGNVLFEVWRFSPKTFRPHYLNAQNEWTPGLPRNIRRVLYRLPELIAADPKQPVFICNGEKAVKALLKRGLVATCNQGGEVIKWRDHPEWLPFLKGRYCVILQDNDPTGEAHAREVFETLTQAGIRAKKLLLPSLPDGGDVCDWLEAGATTEELLEVAKPEASRMRLKLLARAELLTQADALWQIEGLFYEESLVEIFGQSNSGKSFFAVDLAQTLCRGGSWCGKAIVRPGSVLYVNADSGRKFKDRIAAWIEANGDDTNFEFWTYPEPIQLHDVQQVRELIEMLRELDEPPAFMIIDTLSRCIAGMNENLQEYMSLVVDHLTRIKNEFGCTPLVLHHTDKRGETDRGSNVLRGACDTVIRIDQGEDKLITFSCDKQRDAEQFESLYFRLQPMGPSAVLVQVQAPEGKPRQTIARNARRDFVYSIIAHAEGLTQEEIIGRTPGYSQASVSRYLSDLEDEQIILVERPPAVGIVHRPARYYVRPGAEERF